MGNRLTNKRVCVPIFEVSPFYGTSLYESHHKFVRLSDEGFVQTSAYARHWHGNDLLEVGMFWSRDHTAEPIEGVIIAAVKIGKLGSTLEVKLGGCLRADHREPDGIAEACSHSAHTNL